MEALTKIIYNYELPLAVRLTAWAKWCKLFDQKEAEEDKRVLACKSYEL